MSIQANVYIVGGGESPIDIINLNQVPHREDYLTIIGEETSTVYTIHAVEHLYKNGLHSINLHVREKV